MRENSSRCLREIFKIDMAWQLEDIYAMIEIDAARISDSTRPLKVLAVASGGGHWEQMMLLREMLDNFNVTFVTTNYALVERASISSSQIMPDCNRNTFGGATKSLFRAFQIVFREKPDIIITTGAMPGLFCLLAGHWTKATTIWLDSVANVERLSSCGSVARRFASICLTQWEHLVDRDVQFAGRLL